MGIAAVLLALSAGMGSVMGTPQLLPCLDYQLCICSGMSASCTDLRDPSFPLTKLSGGGSIRALLLGNTFCGHINASLLLQSLPNLQSLALAGDFCSHCIPTPTSLTLVNICSKPNPQKKTSTAKVTQMKTSTRKMTWTVSPLTGGKTTVTKTLLGTSTTPVTSTTLVTTTTPVTATTTGTREETLTAVVPSSLPTIPHSRTSGTTQHQSSTQTTPITTTHSTTAPSTTTQETTPQASPSKTVRVRTRKDRRTSTLVAVKTTAYPRPSTPRATSATPSRGTRRTPLPSPSTLSSALSSLSYSLVPGHPSSTNPPTLASPDSCIGGMKVGQGCCVYGESAECDAKGSTWPRSDLGTFWIPLNTLILQDSTCQFSNGPLDFTSLAKNFALIKTIVFETPKCSNKTLWVPYYFRLLRSTTFENIRVAYESTTTMSIGTASSTLNVTSPHPTQSFTSPFNSTTPHTPAGNETQGGETHLFWKAGGASFMAVAVCIILILVIIACKQQQRIRRLEGEEMTDFGDRREQMRGGEGEEEIGGDGEVEAEENSDRPVYAPTTTTPPTPNH